MVADAHQGGLLSYPDRTLWIVAAGKPITQGSMRAVAAGVIKHDKGPELHRWRNTITREALRLVGDGWTAVNGPVRLQVALTVPWPSKLIGGVIVPRTSGEVPRVPPIQTPDVDKLLRAVQDALSPRDDKKSGESEKLRDRRFKLLTDDSRVVDSRVAKTYPAPEHTHPWALPWPGAVIRVVPLDLHADPFPESTLSDPGALPASAQALCDQITARN